MKILMRSGMWRETDFAPEEILAYDKIGANTGNLLFAHGVARWIEGADDIEIEAINDSQAKKLHNIHEDYDMLILPFANAFREDFMPFIKNWTRIVKEAQIPCIVVGIGTQTWLSRADNIEFTFDNDVKNFCDAVLEKSKTIGVRGEITKNYLVRCGVKEDRIRVIGCPSIFINGDDFIPVEKKPFEEIRHIAFNGSKMNPKMEFVNKWMNQYKNSTFIAQETWEALLLYTGIQIWDADNGYFIQQDNELFQEGRIISFLDTRSWLSYLNHNIDVSFGTRIHGNIASYMAGVPGLPIASDTRIKEICDFFKIPYKTFGEINEKTDLEEWYNGADFSAYNNRYPEALAIYKEFFIENGIPHRVPQKRFDLLPEEETRVISNCMLLDDETRFDQKEKFLLRQNERAKKDGGNISIPKPVMRSDEFMELNKRMDELQKELNKTQQELNKTKKKVNELQSMQGSFMKKVIKKLIK